MSTNDTKGKNDTKDPGTSNSSQRCVKIVFHSNFDHDTLYTGNYKLPNIGMNTYQLYNTYVLVIKINYLIYNVHDTLRGHIKGYCFLTR